MRRKITVWLILISLVLGLFSPAAAITADAASPKLGKTRLTLDVGKKQTLKVKNASGKVKWSSSNKKVASVSKKGTVTAKKAGNAKITAKIGKKKLVCKVTVKSKAGLNYKSAGLEVKETLSLKLNGVKGGVKWSSSNKTVASVSKKGKVTAKKSGKATIKAKAGKKAYSCKITVAPRKLNKTEADLKAGETLTLSLSNSFGTLKWASSDNKVATVSSKGVVTAKAAGQAVISVACNRKKYSCKVTVADLPKKNPGAKIDIVFTNEGIESLEAAGGGNTYQSLTVSEESVVITGTVTCEKTELAKLSYDLRDSTNVQKAKGALPVSDKFSATLKPGTGTSTLIVTAEGTDGTTAKKNLTIVRYSTKVTIGENVIGLDEPESKDFVNRIEDINYTEKTENIGGSSIPQTYIDITTDTGSQLVKKLKNGTYKKGDIVYIPSEERLPTGFTGVLVSYETNGSKATVTFRKPDFSDLFQGEGCIEASQIDQENPVAFTVTPADMASISGQTKARASSKKYSRQAFPAGFSVNLNPKVDLSGNSISFGMDFSNIILFDKDMDPDTKDQLILSGSVGIDDMRADTKIEWKTLLPQQIRFNESHTSRTNLKLTMPLGQGKKEEDKDEESLSITDIVAAANGEFKNECEYMGITLSGIDMDNRILIGIVGIHLQPLVDIDAAVLGHMDTFIAKTLVSPIAFAALYMDLDGKISGDISLNLDCTTYTEQGLNLYNSKYSNIKYDSPVKPDQTLNLGEGYKLETYSNERKGRDDYSKPGPVVTLDGRTTAESEVALGAMAGVMYMGIVPADIYLEAFTSSKVEFEGKLAIKNGVTDESLHRDNPPGLRATLTLGAGIRAGYDLKLTLSAIVKVLGGDINLGFEKSDSKEIKFLDVKLDFPKYSLWGTTSRLKKLGSTEKELLPGAAFKIYEKDKLDENTKNYTEAILSKFTPDFTGTSEADGSYNIKGMKRKEYVVLVTKDKFEPLIETIDFNSDVEKIFCLTPLRDKNWLDVCQPWKYDGYHGETFIGDGKGSMKISGVEYDIGFVLDGGDAGSPNTYAYWNLGRKYSQLKVRIGHVDTSSVLTATLKVYLDGADEPNQTIPMDPKAASKEYTIDFNYANTAVFKMERGGISNWAHAKYGFVEGVWYGLDGAQGTVITKDPFENADWNADFMTLCPPFLYDSCDVYKESDDNIISVAGVEYNTGFALYTSGGGFAVFNTDGHFSDLEVTVGLTTNSARTYQTTAYVFLDGETEPSLEYPLKPSTIQTLTIPLNHAHGVRIQLGSKSDSMNGAGASYGFVDGKWIGASSGGGGGGGAGGR